MARETKQELAQSRDNIQALLNSRNEYITEQRATIQQLDKQLELVNSNLRIMETAYMHIYTRWLNEQPKRK